MAHAVTFPTAAPTRRPVLRSVPRPAPAPATRRSIDEVAIARPGLRLTRRGRVVAFTASLLVLLAVVLASGRLSAQAGAADLDGGPATSVVVVQPGESLWQIARQIAPQSDPRSVVTAIRELNDLGVRTVVPGQSLVVPVYTAS